MKIKSISASVFSILLTIFLVNPGSVSAQNTLVLSVTGPIPGLTFLTPRPTPPPIPALTFSAISIPSQTDFTPAPELKLEVVQPKPLDLVIGPNLALDSATGSATFVSPTPTQTPVDTPSPSPVDTPKPTAKPTEKPISTAPPKTSGGLNADVLFSMVNDHRASINQPAFQKDDKMCSLAQSRAPEIRAEIYGGYMHKGLKDRHLPYWETENIISMNSEKAAFNWWINDKIHRDAIEGNYKYSCMACNGNECAEEFTNYQPK